MKHVLLSFLTIAVCLIFSTDKSWSIPAFARKYNTSCATCHNGYPKMTAFGEAFRRNGFQFPAGTDPEMTKEAPVSLGADGNKKAFPDAIWPGSIPGSSPLSVFLNSEIAYNPKTDPRFDFGGLGNSIEAVAGGTVGEDLSFWGQLALGSDGTVELNRIYLLLSNVIGDNYNFNVKVGAFEPGMFAFSTHRAWLEGYWLTTRPFSDDMAWSIEEYQRGVEVSGLMSGRFGYNAGLVEGFGNAHSDKDVYAHVTYKVNGLPLDGVVEGGTAVANSQPYIDNSVTLGAFIYHGNASIGPDDAQQTNKFTTVGGDVNASMDRFNVFGGIGVRHDENPFLGTTGVSANTTVCFAEADVTVFPWLLPGVRFESWKSEAIIDPITNETGSYTDNQIVPGIVALVRPNVKMTLRTSLEKFDSRGDTKFDFGQFTLGLTVGM